MHCFISNSAYIKENANVTLIEMVGLYDLNFMFQYFTHSKMKQMYIRVYFIFNQNSII